MKVGTDGVLLGAWALNDATIDTTQYLQILDIGTGSGLVALMLAQRFLNANILGIDIDVQAVEQANENFAQSPWEDRLLAQTISLQELAQKTIGQGVIKMTNATHSALFDVIVSNPPFFNNGPNAGNSQRTAARRTDFLTLDELLTLGNQLLNHNGIFIIILPAWEKDKVLELAAQQSLRLSRLLSVQGRKEKPAKRILFEFVKPILTDEDTNVTSSFVPTQSTLILESSPNVRTAEYSELTKEFYL